jgi:iron(III) transport system permease protein
MWLYQRLTAHQERFATITGKGYRPRQVHLGKWTAPAAVLCLLYVLIAVLLPFLILLWTSVQPFYAPPSAESLARASFEGYETFGATAASCALWNTTLLALVTSAATIVLAVLVSWFVAPPKPRQRNRQLSRHGFVLAAMRADIVIGLALIFVYVRFPIPIYGTLWIIAWR